MTDYIIVERKNELVPFDLLLLADPSMDQINQYLNQSKILFAKLDNKIVGVLAVKGLKDENAEIMNIAIHPNFQGKGIGSNLIHTAIQLAKKSSCKKLHIGTANTSFDQLRLYEKLGFSITGKLLNYFPEHYDAPIYENGKQAIDMIQLEMSLS